MLIQGYICAASTDVRTTTGMGTQALFGQRFDMISSQEEMIHGALYSILPGETRIDYIGTIPAEAFSKGSYLPTHRVSAVAAPVFVAGDIKSECVGSLPRNAALAGHQSGDFLKRLDGGFIHLKHLLPVSDVAARDFWDIAQDMLALPYVWGGTGHIGVDCSGLVQSALAATGVDAPRDADQQEAQLGRSVNYADRTVGDLLFWPGHVGIIIENDVLLHANAHHMCVAVEAVEQAVSQIGQVRTAKRLTLD